MFGFSWLFFLGAVVSTTYPKASNIPHWRNDIHYSYGATNEETLVLTHVLFRHGNRTAEVQCELYPNDPYLHETYHPYGHGQLTSAGQAKEFSVGAALRTRYDQFLGHHYYPEMIQALSTDYDRTKMSLELVLAGLFDPENENVLEEAIHWPYQFMPRQQDKVLLGVLCPRYQQLYEEISASSEIQEDFESHKEVFDYISVHTGLNVTRFFDAYNLYFGITTEAEWGFQLPKWTEPIWPEILTSLAVKDYFVSMATEDMRKMAVGYFLGKVIDDTKAKIFSSQKPGRKMHLYSAHESNIAELLISLGVFEPHVPNYGSFVSLEIHYIANIYGVKIFYENYAGGGPQLLKMPDCNAFCPLDAFINLVQKYVPSEELCGN